MARNYGPATVSRGKESRFAGVPSADIQRSSFKRDHSVKTTFDSGFLVPFFVDEVLPGDTFSLSATLLTRLNTPMFPVMDNMYLDTFFFFVPNRLLWENWERFCGAQDSPSDSTDYLIPQVQLGPGSRITHSLADYFGLPTVDQVPSGNISVSALPFRAYNLIYNEWFRDENLQDSLAVPIGDGPDVPPLAADIYQLRRRGKRHDYFTSALPWPQKGPAVSVPLGDSAPVTLSTIGDTELVMYQETGVGGDLTAQPANTGSSARGVVFNTDLSEATAATINTLRQAFQVQRFLERQARGGTRYTEILRSHFRVISPDARLQRPEYLGGGSTPINVTPVAQNVDMDSQGRPLGSLGGVGLSVQSGHGFHKSFVEHGFIIGLVNVRADLTYWQGLSRMWTRNTIYDHYWPVFGHLGEQAVLNKELKYMGDSADDDVFGYQERYAEYRYKQSLVTGKMRPDNPQSLAAWHLAQDFAGRPTLGPTFISENPPIERVVAVQDEPQFHADMFVKLNTARPMPVYGVPGLIDHF